MGRSLRKNNAGIYHIVNRGVGLREVFLSAEDKLFFINLLSDYAVEYEYVLHAYAVLDNGYNIVIETYKNNLSEFMKLINFRYAFYFNKKYMRRGYLWEGRFKSWCITKEEFLFDIVAYIEHLPVYTGISKSKEESYYSTYRQFIGLDQRLSCISKSIIFKKFNNTSDIKIFFSKSVDIQYINRLHEKLKRKNKHFEKEKKELPPLKKLNLNISSHSDRNEKIYILYKKGYTQRVIAEEFGITQQAVHKIIKKIIKK